MCIISYTYFSKCFIFVLVNSCGLLYFLHFIAVNSSTVYIPSTDSATVDINPSNIQDTDCGGITEEMKSTKVQTLAEILEHLDWKHQFACICIRHL